MQRCVPCRLSGHASIFSSRQIARHGSTRSRSDLDLPLDRPSAAESSRGSENRSSESTTLPKTIAAAADSKFQKLATLAPGSNVSSAIRRFSDTVRNLRGRRPVPASSSSTMTTSSSSNQSSCQRGTQDAYVEDAFVAELQAVAAGAGFPRADRGVSERIEKREQE